VLGAALITTFISTLLFWKYRSHLTIETIVVIALTFSLVSGHRNYQLDAPKELSHLAWTLGIEPQNFFVALGVMLSLIFGGFLVAASSRPIIGGKIRSTNVGRVGKWSRFILPLSLFGLLIVYAQYVSSRYSENLGRASEGVGEGSEEGKSPLGFHSAVGKTKQPAALIRFEGDYPNNPWAPMLYIREGALSSFNGKEMVLAPRQFDSDVPRTSPGQPFLALEKDVTPAREEVTYSVFLLAQHKTAIAIDYPKSIRPIKNPDSNRFVATYQAVSIAPKVKLEQLSGEEFGDPSWSDEIRQHYLRAPGDQENSPSLPTSLSTPLLDSNREDLRYRALSKEIVDGLQTPFERAAGVINYLSKNSIYTRQPGHQSTNGGDPVAPYLFAEEKRGYCVHFAHAAVYLLRLAGIPARIGTGYLTDLSFAKDGHVLLNMGDRHAWPEVYVKGVGWAVFDIQPAKAENEIVQPPDEKLLEELMSKLDELGELTPPMPLDSPETGSSFGDQIIDTLSDKVLYLRLLAILIALFVLTKLYLRAGYTLTNDPRRKAIRAYQSVASNFCDLGEPRKYGETRLEYFERLKNLGKVKSLLVSQLYNEAHFSASKPTFSNNAVQAALRDSISEDGVFRKIVRQILAFVSPFSILRWGKW
jgi:transglutaminase-like putative cysteine protease